MAKYRTALGKEVDMSTLMAKNERIRAVGNMRVNARGDTIDSHGRIIVPVTEKVNQAYAKTVGSKAAHATKKQQQRPKPPVNKQVEELHQIEKDIESNLDDELEVEAIKAKEMGKK